MKPKFFPTRAHLLLCSGPNCRARGGDVLALALQRALEREGLMYYKQGGSVRYGTASCLGACAHGPVACVYRSRGGALEQAWYAGLNLPRALELARAAHEEGELPETGRYDTPE